MAARDAVIVGGGTIGLSIAWQARLRGLDVVVVDPHPGRGASWAAAGMLAPATEVHYGEESLLRLNLAANDMWPGFARELENESGLDSGYRQCGTLVVARDADDNAELSELFSFQARLGLDSERLRGREARSLEPALAPSIRGGILVRGDHQVDNRTLVDTLLAACVGSGVVLIEDTVARVEVEGGRAVGVRTASAGLIEAGNVVLAAGAASAGIAGVPEAARPPVRPVKGQLLILRGPPDDVPFSHNIRGLDVYLVSRGDGRVVVGATVEERGFDTRVTAGGVHDLLRAAIELVPGLTELELVESVAGLRPGTPDNAPLLGATAVEGLIAATGHFRNGILLTPLTATAIADGLAGETPHVDVSVFSPQRFAPEPVP